MAKVVVVEDDRDIATLVAHKLRTGGHDVVVEHDGQAGLAAVRQLHPALVVLDWMMPRMSGIEVCEAIRQDPTLAGTRVLVLTAKSQESDLERAFAVGADEFLLKPFSPRELVLRANALLAR
ncbi:response regulator transcription factor [Cellulomonas soli]